MRQLLSPSRMLGITGLLAAVLLTSACSPDFSLAPEPEAPESPATTLLQLTCTGSVSNQSLSCHAPTVSQQIRASRNAAPSWHVGEDGVKRHIIGGQGVYVQLTSTNVSYNSTTEIFQFDVTVQNLLNEALGSVNGLDPDSAGIKVFFHAEPTATVGTGSIAVANADGAAMFTGSNQSYFKYNEVLETNEVSSVRTWELAVPNTVDNFTFTVLVETVAQTKLVINEMAVRPPQPTITDANGEWVELYNAGTLAVDLQNLVIADSAASGRRPYHRIASSIIVPAGGYVVLGNNSNTTLNGGVPVDYSYGSALQFANSLDAFKIARVVGTDTITLDRTQYANVSATPAGVSRELKNPALDNWNMDGSNWDNATVTSVFGVWGRGTPKAQNSTYTP